MRTLILFDIDGTLLAPHGVGRKAMEGAMAAFFGSGEAMRRVEMAGKCDWGIWRDALALESYSDEEADAHLPELYRLYVAELARILASPDHRQPEVLPGIGPLLEALRARDDVLLGLLTGNLEPAAWLKLGSVGLDRYFRFGAFGNDAPNRDALPRIAVERAARFADGHQFARKNVLIVGDTVHDIRCGAELGVCAVGVATGSTDAATLRAAGADYVFDSFAAHEEFLQVLPREAT
jgi:phosphoglycolate phosphatase-like HAD superfamily hydrolase